MIYMNIYVGHTYMYTPVESVVMLQLQLLLLVLVVRRYGNSRCTTLVVCTSAVMVVVVVATVASGLRVVKHGGCGGSWRSVLKPPNFNIPAYMWHAEIIKAWTRWRPILANPYAGCFYFYLYRYHYYYLCLRRSLLSLLFSSFTPVAALFLRYYYY